MLTKTELTEMQKSWQRENVSCRKLTSGKQHEVWLTERNDRGNFDYKKHQILFQIFNLVDGKRVFITPDEDEAWKEYCRLEGKKND